MKKKWAAVSVVAVVLVGIPPAARANSADATSAIRENYKEWLAAYDAKNLDGTINIFAEDRCLDVRRCKRCRDRGNSRVVRKITSRKRAETDVEAGRDGNRWRRRSCVCAGRLAAHRDASGRIGFCPVDEPKRRYFPARSKTWKIVRSFTIPADKRPVKLSCEVRLPSISPDTLTGAAADVWQTLMRWRESYNRRDLAGTLAPYDRSLTGLYAGNMPDDLAKLRDSYMRSFAQNDRQRSIDFEPEEILTSGRLALCVTTGPARSEHRRDRPKEFRGESSFGRRTQPADGSCAITLAIWSVKPASMLPRIPARSTS